MYALPAAVTMANASRSLVDLQRAIDGGETEIGLAALAHSDSSAVAVLLAAQRYAGKTGKTLRVTGMPPSLRSLATMYGVDGLIPAA